MNLLFVCLGNICRSPMAEAMMKDRINQAGLANQVKIDSAGTSDFNKGKFADSRTVNQLNLHDVPAENLISRQITRADILENDYVICMDDSNVSNVKEMFADLDCDNVIGINDITPNKKGVAVDDPWFTGDFETTYSDIDYALDFWMDKIKSEL